MNTNKRTSVYIVFCRQDIPPACNRNRVDLLTPVLGEGCHIVAVKSSVLETDFTTAVQICQLDTGNATNRGLILPYNTQLLLQPFKFGPFEMKV